MNIKTSVRTTALISLLALVALASVSAVSMSGTSRFSSYTEDLTESLAINTAAILISSPVASDSVITVPVQAILPAPDVIEAFSLFERAVGLGQRFVLESGRYAEMETGPTAIAFPPSGSLHASLESAL